MPRPVKKREGRRIDPRAVQQPSAAAVAFSIVYLRESAASELIELVEYSNVYFFDFLFSVIAQYTRYVFVVFSFMAAAAALLLGFSGSSKCR